MSHEEQGKNAERPPMPTLADYRRAIQSLTGARPMSEDTGTNTGGTEGEENDAGLVDPSTGLPFPDTKEGRADKKAYLDKRRNERHPHGGPPGQARKKTVTDGATDPNDADQG